MAYTNQYAVQPESSARSRQYDESVTNSMTSPYDLASCAYRTANGERLMIPPATRPVVRPNSRRPMSATNGTVVATHSNDIERSAASLAPTCCQITSMAV